MSKRPSDANQDVFEAIRNDPELMNEILSSLDRRDIELPRGLSLEGLDAASMMESFAAGGAVEGDPDLAAFAEAIILRRGRPSFLIRDDDFEIPAAERVWAQRLLASRPFLKKVIRAVGRMEVTGHPDFQWLGTAWLVAPDVIVTNRHVAREFARGTRGSFAFLPGISGGSMGASIDFREEFGSNASESIAVAKVLHIADEGLGQPDMAVLKLQTRVNREPIALADSSTPTGEYVAVVGYPARDDRRNDPGAARDIFRDIYEKKRLAPGQLRQPATPNPVSFQHDCSTLGGNSGSAVVDAKNGKAVGLHFGGRFEVANHAVRVETIKRVLSVARTSTTGAIPTEAPAASPDDYIDRPGYDPAFIGDSDELFVPLPEVSGARQRDIQRQTRGPHRNSAELRYMHFSIVMSKSRKLPFFTASNIDGSSAQRPHRRRDVWKFDPRIPESAQLGEDLYANNNLDRGHLVRRLDPVWGDDDEARLAEDDTFHFSNCSPQHKRLNQGQRFWAGLEDYILNNTDERNLRVSVFTGPVFGRNDLAYRHVKIPQEFWKVVVNMRSDGQLSATGYVLSQGEFMDDLEFAFGPFRTFQTSISQIERLTGLRFGTLSEHDPLANIESVQAAVPLEGYESIVLS